MSNENQNQEQQDIQMEKPRHDKDANYYIDQAIIMIKEQWKDEWLVAGYNGIISLLVYAKESHKYYSQSPKEEKE